MTQILCHTNLDSLSVCMYSITAGKVINFVFTAVRSVGELEEVEGRHGHISSTTQGRR